MAIHDHINDILAETKAALEAVGCKNVYDYDIGLGGSLDEFQTRWAEDDTKTRQQGWIISSDPGGEVSREVMEFGTTPVVHDVKIMGFLSFAEDRDQEREFRELASRVHLKLGIQGFDQTWPTADWVDRPPTKVGPNVGRVDGPFNVRVFAVEFHAFPAVEVIA